MRGRSVIFPWKQHVRWETAGLVLWTSGALDFYITHMFFGQAHITGLHAVLAWPIIGLSLYGLLSGYLMNRHKKKSFWLPLTHGIGNSILIALVVAECCTGIGLYDTFLG